LPDIPQKKSHSRRRGERQLCADEDRRRRKIMILQKFNYFEFADNPNSWTLDGMILENINLLVGKNATGKTNTLTKIAWLGNMLAGTQPQLLNSGN
jgi:signal recognition particle GTPase